MAMIHFTFDQALTESFAGFEYDLYRGDAQWIPPIRKEVYSQFSPEFPFYQKPGNCHRHFLVTIGKKVVGRISAMVNKDLKDKDGTPVGTIGFFECIYDYSVANDLFDAAIKWLSQEQGLNRIWGPMNFDIWHGYRLMTYGFDQKLFYGEPYNKDYYPDFFAHYGFVPKQCWDSVEISGAETIEKMIVRGAERYQLLTDRGYRFEPFDMNKSDDELRKLHLVMTKSFSGFPGFTPISFAEFEPLFAKSRYAFHPRLSIFAYNENDDLAGFAAAFLELSDAIRAMNGKDDFISKLRFLRYRRHVNRINFYIGGVTPEEAARKMGLGRAGFYYVINQMLREGFETLLLTLRLKGNKAHGLLGKNAPKPQREYALFELNR
jgi:hypothetical protein